MKIVIGITGKKLSGKSTLCSMIAEHCNHRYYKTYYYHIGVHIKHAIITNYQILPIVDNNFRKLFNNTTDYQFIDFSREQRALNVPEAGTTLDKAMQLAGADLRQKFGENVLIDKTISQICSDNTDGIIIVDGVRHHSDIKRLKEKFGAKIIKVDRVPEDIDTRDNNHESEIALDDYTDYDDIIGGEFSQATVNRMMELLLCHK